MGTDVRRGRELGIFEEVLGRREKVVLGFLKEAWGVWKWFGVWWGCEWA